MMYVLVAVVVVVIIFYGSAFIFITVRHHGVAVENVSQRTREMHFQFARTFLIQILSGLTFAGLPITFFSLNVFKLLLVEPFIGIATLAPLLVTLHSIINCLSAILLCKTYRKAIVQAMMRIYRKGEGSNRRNKTKSGSRREAGDR
ncbi:unnamed protein product, partial [Mesorhabditis spiculigera]